jgi:hypothetical protein
MRYIYIYIWTTYPGGPEELAHSRSKVKLGHFIALGFSLRTEGRAVAKPNVCFRYGWQFGVTTPFEVEKGGVRVDGTWTRYARPSAGDAVDPRSPVDAHAKAGSRVGHAIAL